MLEIIKTLASDIDIPGQVRDIPGGGTDLMVFVKNILSVVFAVVGIIAVIMIIVGGVYYSTSMGDPTKIKKGKDTIMYGIIGLVISLLAFAIVQFVLQNI